MDLGGFSVAATTPFQSNTFQAPRLRLVHRQPPIKETVTAHSQMRYLLTCLVKIGAPRVAMQLVTLIYMACSSMPSALAQDIDCSEYFAGCMQVSQF